MLIIFYPPDKPAPFPAPRLMIRQFFSGTRSTVSYQIVEVVVGTAVVVVYCFCLVLSYEYMAPVVYKLNAPKAGPGRYSYYMRS